MNTEHGPITSFPLKWHGGKQPIASWIWSLAPKHLCYVEPFAGGLAVLLSRDPLDRRYWLAETGPLSGVAEIANDIDGRLVNFWRVIRDEVFFPRFVRQVEAIPFARAEWEASARHPHGGEDSVADAVAFFVCCRQSLSGRMDTFTPLTPSRTRRQMEEHVSSWLTAVEGLPRVHARLRQVAVENRDAVDLIEAVDRPTTLFYVDPPYLHSTRSSTEVYSHEMSEAGHIRLLHTLLSCEGKVMISGYPSVLYDNMLKEWNRHTRDVANHSASGKAKERKTECLWCNF